LNLFLPGRGTVYLGPITMVQTDGPLIAVANPGAWWSDRTAGIVGGLGGAVVGCLVTLLAWMTGRAKGRSFVLGTLTILIGIGAILVLAAMGALALKQPYAVWFPLGLVGLLLGSILPARLRQSRKAYEETELRRMASVDALKA
jgi:hypothetical protein